MKKVFVDTNSLLRYLFNDIPAQADQVENKLKEAKNGNIILNIPQIVIFELQFTLAVSYKKPKEEIVDKISTILSIPFVEIDDRASFIEAIGLYARTKFDFVDCFLIRKAKNEGGTLLTFDKNLKKLDSV